LKVQTTMDKPADDPYSILGVPRDATQDTIRLAYRKLAKQHHPDLNPGNEAAEARFKTVSAANEILSDPEKRKQFDRGEIDRQAAAREPPRSYRHYAEGGAGHRYAPRGADFNTWSSDDVKDMFGTMFSDESPRRGRDERYTLTTDFLDAVNGATKRLTLPDGRQLDIKIPPGTMDGNVLRLRGKGGAGQDAGDALIEIHVNKHRYFIRDGQNIRVDLPVSLQEAVLGGPIEIPTPSGKVRMQIPPASDTGTELRLRGRGVPAHADRAAGDLYATLRVALGVPDPALEAFLRTWKPEHPGHPRRLMEPV
jgi:DnaJ-class molecular chaperone